MVETHAVIGQPLKIRCPDRRMAVWRGVLPPHIVCYENDEVGRGGGYGRFAAGSGAHAYCKKQEGKKEISGHGPGCKK